MSEAVAAAVAIAGELCVIVGADCCSVEPGLGMVGKQPHWVAG